MSKLFKLVVTLTFVSAAAVGCGGKKQAKTVPTSATTEAPADGAAAPEGATPNGGSREPDKQDPDDGGEVSPK